MQVPPGVRVKMGILLLAVLAVSAAAFPPDVERRVFLAGISAAVAGTAGFSPYGPLAIPESAAANAPARALFDGWLGSEFRIYETDGRFVDTARLTSIEDGPFCAGLEQFSLIFESARTEALPERIFRLTGPHGQEMDVALAPTAARPRRHRAVFSLLARA